MIVHRNLRNLRESNFNLAMKLEFNYAVRQHLFVLSEVEKFAD